MKEAWLHPYKIAPEQRAIQKQREVFERSLAQFKENWIGLIRMTVDGPDGNTRRLAEGNIRSLNRLAESLNLLDFDDHLEAKIEAIFEIVARVSYESRKAFGEKKWNDMIASLEELRKDARSMGLRMQKEAKELRRRKASLEAVRDGALQAA